MRTWADDFNTYAEACEYYGADTPASLAAEARYEAEIYGNEIMDQMYAGIVQPGALWSVEEECPF
jgi:hypothetical protein